jgi:hypothetical protein
MYLFSPAMNRTAKVFLVLFACAVGCACQKRKGVHYSNYEPAGQGYITMILDSDTVDNASMYNAFFMELMTKKDTFLVRPSERGLIFPKLADSLTAINVFYNDWKFTAAGDVLKYEYELFYFPGDSATIALDAYPFTERHATSRGEPKKKQVFLEMRKKNMRLFMCYMDKYRVMPNKK